MSRILRRPMFRGGSVSAYGTGIAAPLVPGYAGGGQIGGGIIYGKPMADGRYGFDNPIIDQSTIGANVVKKAKDKTSNWEDLVALEEFSSVPKYDEDFLKNKFDSFVKGVERRVGYGEDDAFQTDVDLGMQLQPPIDPDDAAFWKIYNEDPEQAYKYWKENISTWGTKQKEQMEHAKKIGADVDYGIKSDTDKKITVDPRDVELAKMQQIIEQLLKDKNTEASTEIDKDEIFKMLGGDKARGRDITNMLLGFAGAQGDDTMSKFQNFAAAEAKRPGEQARLKETAGTLAVKDKLDARKAERNIAQVLGLEKAKIGMKTAAESLGNLDWQTRKLTIAKSMQSTPTSAAVIRQTLMYEPSEQGKRVTVTNDTKVVTEPDKFDVGLYVLDAGEKGKQVIEIIEVNGIKEAKPRNEYII
jgi:hypothetical protein